MCISCAVDALPGQCLRRTPGTNPLVAAVFRTKRLWLERCSATCQRRRRPGQARRGQGRLQITAVLRGRSHLGARWLGSADQVDRARRHFPLGLGEDRPLCVILVASIPVVPVPCLRGGRVRGVWHSGVLFRRRVGWGGSGHRCPGYHGGTAVAGAGWSRSGRPARARPARAGTSG